MHLDYLKWYLDKYYHVYKTSGDEEKRLQNKGQFNFCHTVSMTLIFPVSRYCLCLYS